MTAVALLVRHMYEVPTKNPLGLSGAIEIRIEPKLNRANRTLTFWTEQDRNRTGVPKMCRPTTYNLQKFVRKQYFIAFISSLYLHFGF